MNRDRRTSPSANFFQPLGILFSVAAILLAFFQPLRVGAGFLNFSPSGLAALLIPVGVLVFIWIIRSSFGLKEKLCALLSIESRRFDFLCALTLICVLAALPPLFARLRFGTTGDFADRVFYTRAEPVTLSVWGLAAALLPFAWAPRSAVIRYDRRSAAIFVGFMAAVGAVAVLIRQTELGLTRENAFWGEPTVPLLEIHFVIAFLALWLFIRFFSGEKFRNDRRAGLKIGLALYLLTAVVWLSIPNREGFFSPPGRAPNFELYPFSDGAFYGHYARALINGMGFKGADIPPRPLYILMLALCHLPFGTSYSAVIFCQTLVLALIPVLLFRIGRELHSHEAGIAAALLYLLREVHAINAAPYAHNVSITKYFFADLPTALAAAFFFWMTIRLVKSLCSDSRSDARPSSLRSVFYALMSGGALGLSALIRTQSLSLAPLALASALFVNIRNSPRKVQTMLIRLGLTGLILLGVVLTVSPWLIRNRAIAGSFVFDHPRTQTGELASSYNIGGFDLTRDPGMSDGAYQEKLSAAIRLNLTRYPDQIAAFVSAHFLNALVASVRLFPIRPSLNEYAELLGGTPFWEMGLDSETPALVALGLILSCLLLAAGFTAAVRRSGFLAWLPLLGMIGFHFSTALGRYSAGRYLIPMDWALFVYFGAALAAVITTLQRISGFRAVRNDFTLGTVEPKRISLKSPIIAALIFLLIGCALPLAAKAFPLTLADASRTTAAEKLALTETVAARYDYLGGAIAIYPRFYEAGDGEPESAKVGYETAPEGRLMFLTLAPEGFGTIRLRLDDAPDFFPDNATVWIAGTMNGAVTDAALVLVEADGKSARYEASAAAE